VLGVVVEGKGGVGGRRREVAVDWGPTFCDLFWASVPWANSPHSSLLYLVYSLENTTEYLSGYLISNRPSWDDFRAAV
jgi:hypothetical protein